MQYQYDAHFHWPKIPRVRSTQVFLILIETTNEEPDSWFLDNTANQDYSVGVREGVKELWLRSRRGGNEQMGSDDGVKKNGSKILKKQKCKIKSMEKYYVTGHIRKKCIWRKRNALWQRSIRKKTCDIRGKGVYARNAKNLLIHNRTDQIYAKLCEPKTRRRHGTLKNRNVMRWRPMRAKPNRIIT